MNDNVKGAGEPLSDARLRWAMELGTRMAVEQAEFAVKARIKRLRTMSLTAANATRGEAPR